MSDRIPKRIAHYRPAEDPARSCGTCSMFLAATGRCTLVRGPIDPADTCDYWAAPQAVTKSQVLLPINVPGVGRDHVRVVVLDATGRLLLLQRADTLVWEVVQGKVADIVSGETPRQAAERELGEETGYIASALRWRQLYRNCWAVELPPGAGDPVISTEHYAWRWFPVEAGVAWLAREQFYASILRAAARPWGYDTRPTPPSAEKALALHEASHAVISLLWDVPVRQVSIVPRSTDAGHIEWEPEPTDNPGALLAVLAGPAASTKVGASFIGGRWDHDLAVGLAKTMAWPGEADALLTAARDGVAAELEDPRTWGQIETVAEALLKHRTLSGADVAAILGGVWN